MQRDLPSATSMVSFPQSGNQLFTRRWMPWFALAWKPRGPLPQYPGLLTELLHRGSWQVCASY